MVEVVMGRWFFSIEVAEGNVGAEQGDGVFDGGGVSYKGSRF